MDIFQKRAGQFGRFPSPADSLLSRHPYLVVCGAIMVTVVAFLVGLSINRRTQKSTTTVVQPLPQPVPQRAPAPASEVTVGLPKAFGGSIRVASLLKLFDAAHQHLSLSHHDIRLRVEEMGRS